MKAPGSFGCSGSVLEADPIGHDSYAGIPEVVGNERTGRDWAKGIVKSMDRRYTFDGVLVWETPGHPKPPPELKVISSRFLSVDERIEIADLHRQGLGLTDRRAVERSPSTISREPRAMGTQVRVTTGLGPRIDGLLGVGRDLRSAS